MAESDKLQHIIQAFKDAPEPKDYHLYAQQCLNAGGLDAALEICREGLAQAPENEKGVLVYLTALCRKGDLATASRVYELAFQLHPSSARVRAMGALVRYREGQTELAMRLANEATELDPEDRQAWTILATLNLRPISSEQASEIALSRLDEESPGRTPSTAELEGIVEAIALHAPEDQGSQTTDIDRVVAGLSLKSSAPPASAEPAPLSPGTPTRTSLTVIADSTLEGLAAPSPADAPDPSPARTATPPQTESGYSHWIVAPRADQKLPLVRVSVQPRPKPKPKRRRVDRRIVLAAAASAIIVTAAAVTLLVKPGGSSRRIAEQAGAALSATLDDQLQSYHSARDTLVALSGKHDDPRLHGAIALVEAHLLTRFSEGDEDAVTARLARARVSTESRLARLVLGLQRQTPAELEKELSAISPSAGGWHRRYLALQVALLQSRTAEASQLLDQELKQRRPAVAILAQGATSRRLAGDSSGSLRLLEAGLRIAAAHPGLRIERLLLRASQPDAAKTERGLEDEVRSLLEETRQQPRYQAAALLVVAYAAQANGRAETALKAADRARELHPQSAEATWLAGTWRMGAGQDLASALPLLARGARLMSPYRPTAPLWHARALQLLGRSREACEALPKTLPRLASIEERELQIAASTACAAHTTERVLPLCPAKKTDASAPESCPLGQALGELRHEATAHGGVYERLALAAALIVLGQDALAQLHLGKALAAQPTDQGALAAAAEDHLLLGDVAGAAKALEKACSPSGSASRLQLVCARVALAEKKLSEAEQLFSSALKDKSLAADALIGLWQVAASRGDQPRARQIFERASNAGQDDPLVLLALARAQVELGRMDQVSDLAVYALSLTSRRGWSTGSVLAVTALGRALARGNAQARSAAGDLWFRVCTLKNAPAFAFLELGRLHQQKGDRARAIWSFRQAISRDPQLAIAHRDLGLLLQADRSKGSEGKQALQRYLELDPEAEDAASIAKQLR